MDICSLLAIGILAYFYPMQADYLKSKCTLTLFIIPYTMAY